MSGVNVLTGLPSEASTDRPQNALAAYANALMPPTIPSWVLSARRLWEPAASLPSPPPGYVFPVDAFLTTGTHLWGEDWTDNEMRVARMRAPSLIDLSGGEDFWEDEQPIPPVHEEMIDPYRSVLELMWQFGEYNEIAPTTTDTFTRVDWKTLYDHQEDLRRKRASAHIRRDNVVRFLGEKFASGEIRTLRRKKGGGIPEDVPSEWWQIDDYLPRMIACGLDPDNPYNPMVESTDWFFIESASLGAALAGTVKEPNSSPPSIAIEGIHLSPYIKFMIEVARYADIGPEPEQQPGVESLSATIRELAETRGLELGANEVAKMATFLREPYMKAGLRTVLARHRKGSRTTTQKRGDAL